MHTALQGVVRLESIGTVATPIIRKRLLFRRDLIDPHVVALWPGLRQTER